MTKHEGPTLFVSHHSSKLQTASHVERALNAKGVKCWIAPRDVDPGEPFDRAVRKAIADTDAMLLLFCSKSEKSRHVKRELILADQLGKAIIPLRLERIDPGELSYHLADSQWIDWLEQRDDVVDRVAAKAREFHEQSAFEPSPPVITPATGSGAGSGGGGDIDLASPPDLGAASSPETPPMNVDVEDAAPAHSGAIGAAGDLQPHALGAFPGPGSADMAPPPQAFAGDPGFGPVGGAGPGAAPGGHDHSPLSDPAPPGSRPKKNLLWLWIGLGVLALAGIIALTIWLISRNSSGITEEWFAGEWSDNRDCSSPVTFEDNGRFRTADGSRGEWRIEDGDTLVISGAQGTDDIRLTRISDDEVEGPDGPSYRCD
jgi:hypothetical protein